MAIALATNPSLVQTSDENEIELWRLKKLIKTLECHKG
jgi:hypothetical protein